MRRSSNIIVSRLRVTVEFHQVDMMKVVHNAQYLFWFEKGRLDIIERFISVSWAAANDIAVPVVMNRLEYMYPAVFGDELVVTTRHEIVPEWTGRFSFDHSISNAKTKVELCRGISDVTVMNMSSRRVMKELPVEAWERYRQYRQSSALRG
jgi:YbgC/YbaW family acyl-CoA thioester hydrolase